MSEPIARVLLDELEHFLWRYGKEWDVEGPRSFEELLPPHRPVTVDELIMTIFSANHGEVYAYVVGVEMAPDEALEYVGLDSIPEAVGAELEDYVIRLGKARDFLHVAPSIEDVSNGFYVNLMPVQEEEADLGDEKTTTLHRVKISGLPPGNLSVSGLLSGHSEKTIRDLQPRIIQISIENFKGIGELQTIDLKPITLLFGPNSGGKSTIIQAAHYALEVLDRKNLDADRTALGGPLLDLGGFERFVHKHDLRRQVRLGFGLDLKNAIWPEYSVLVPNRHGAFLIDENSPLPPELQSLTEGLPNFACEITSAFLEVSIAWSEIDRACFIESYRVSANGLPVATVVRDAGGRDIRISDLNTKHPLFRPGSSAGENRHSEDDSILDCWLRLAHGSDDLKVRPLFVAGQKDALPEWGKSLALQLEVMEEWPVKDEVETYWPDWAGIHLISALSQILVGTGELLRNELRQFRYLGPLRETPTRDHRAPRFHDVARWASGLAAWDILYNAGRLRRRGGGLARRA